MFVGVILNPQARRNRDEGSPCVERLREILGDRGEVHVTATTDELTEVVEKLLPTVTHLVSDGGDGALHWLMNEVRSQRGDEDARDWPTFVPTNGGTIDFVARHVGVRGHSVGIATELAAAARRATPPEEATLDTLRLDGVYPDGAPFSRIGFALAAGGVGNRFFDKYYEDPSPTAMTIVRVITRSVRELVTGTLLNRDKHGEYADHVFRPTRANVHIDGDYVNAVEHGAIHAGAFELNLGGVVRLFPMARDPGALHFQAGAVSPAMMVVNLPNLFFGRQCVGPHLLDKSGDEMTIESIDELLRPVLDGEQFPDLKSLTVGRGPRVRIARVLAKSD